jgi:hypothetical protein
VTKEQIIGFGPEQIPRIAFRTKCVKKVSVLADVSFSSSQESHVYDTLHQVWRRIQIVWYAVD